MYVRVDPVGQQPLTRVGMAAVAEALAVRSQMYGARLHAPRHRLHAGRPPLTDDHPVEGEISGQFIHPDDASRSAA